MAIIKARIKSDFYNFNCEVTIIGDGMISRIDCKDDFAKEIISNDIKNGNGRIANAYHPLPNTMLQAYATLKKYSKNIEVEGDIGEIPYNEGVVY